MLYTSYSLYRLIIILHIDIHACTQGPLIQYLTFFVGLKKNGAVHTLMKLGTQPLDSLSPHQFTESLKQGHGGSQTESTQS